MQRDSQAATDWKRATRLQYGRTTFKSNIVSIIFSRSILLCVA
jgi:hypothetical protein